MNFCSKASKIPQTSHLNAAALRACLPLVFCFQTEPAVNACSCNLRTRIHTMRSLLDELDVIECFEVPGNALAVGEVLKKQEELYKSLGVEPLPAKE